METRELVTGNIGGNYGESQDGQTNPLQRDPETQKHMSSIPRVLTCSGLDFSETALHLKIHTMSFLILTEYLRTENL